MTTSKQYRNARSVLQSLIQGVDPATGAELPKDAIVNRIEINRSMLVAMTAMEQVEARMLRRAQLPESVGKTFFCEPANSQGTRVMVVLSVNRMSSFRGVSVAYAGGISHGRVL